MFDYRVVEEYKGIRILQYESENGVRADFGTKRSKLVPDVTEARDLVDFYLSPPDWDEDDA